MTDVNGSRSYVSPRREEAARATRRAVLAAARDCFLDQGYAATTIAQIADRAAVSKPTVYAVGTKAELLKLVRDQAMAGDDDPIPVAGRSSFTTVLAEHDPERALARFASHVVQLLDRYADIDEVLYQAAGVDPELRALWEASEQQRLVAAGLVVENLCGKSPLRPGLDRHQAVQILWVMMAPYPWRRLRSEGWSTERYEAWLAELMITQLLPAADGEGSPRPR